MHGAAPRARALTLLGLAGGLTLAACSSTPPRPSASSSTSSTARPSVTVSTPTVPAPAPTLPTSGPLQVGAPIAVSLSASQVVAAEGPDDNAVFVAAQDPTSTATSIVWVVDGQGPAAIAEHIPAGVAALAVDPTNLYVATYTDVTGFDRTTGGQSGHWSLPAVSTANASDNDLVGLVAAGGYVFVTIAQGNDVNVYRINPSSTSAPKALVSGLGAVIGTDGTVYSERTDHHLVALHLSGSTTVGPLLAAAPNGEGGGVQYLSTVAGGAVWVDEPAGQGLDEEWTTYSTSSLQQQGSFGGSEGESFVDTAAGPLVLASPDVQSACQQGGSQPGTWCVARVSLQGAMSYPNSFPDAVALVGPQPVVISENAAGTQVDITRLT